VAGARRGRPEPFSGGSGTVGRESAQKIISAPNPSIARPVQIDVDAVRLVLDRVRAEDPQRDQDQAVEAEHAPIRRRMSNLLAARAASISSSSPIASGCLSSVPGAPNGLSVDDTSGS
jgi:hypothetical protein